MIRKCAALLTVLILAACVAGPGSLQPPNVTLSNVVPASGMTVFEQRYDVTLRIQNPNNAALPVSGLSYAIKLNGQEFARGVSNEHITVPALGDSLMKVTVTSTALDWLRQIERVQTTPDINPSYEVKGVLYLEGYGNNRLPFSQAGSLGTQH